MARVALLVTVLAAVAYISQAIPVPENVVDEQLKSKEIFEQIQPESKEILDQVQPESKEILDQNQPKSEEILDQIQPKSEEILNQIQPKSEENLDQSDDTSKNELEDSKNKDWRDHKEHNLQKKLEILKNKNQIWGNKGIERKIEIIQQKIQPRTRRNSQYVLTDIPNVNDIEETFKAQLFNLKNVIIKILNFIQEKMSEGIGEVDRIKDIYPLIEKIITQRGEKDEIKKEVQKEIKEKIEEIKEKFEDYEKDIKGVAKDILKNALNFENLEKIKEGIFNQLKEEVSLIFRMSFKTSMNVFHDISENVKKELINLPLTIFNAKINTFEDARQIITDIGTIAFEKVKDYAKKGIKAIESEKGRIGNLLKEAEERFNDKVKPKEVFDKIKPKIEEVFDKMKPKIEEVFDKIKPKIEEAFEESKDKVEENIVNTLKKIEDLIPSLNGFKDLSKGFLLKIKRD